MPKTSSSPTALLTSTQAARQLGVGVTAIKRWTDAGTLACVKTPGGHRRFRARDVAALGRAERAQGETFDEWIDALTNRADIHAVLALLFAERARRGAWSAVATHLGDLLETIGTRWETGTLTVAEEHVASGVLERALVLAAETMVVPVDARRCVLASVEGDEHTLALSLADLCARERGWRSEWLGGRTRTRDLCERLQIGGVQLVGLSASSLMQDRRVLRSHVRMVGAVCQRRGMRLVLGGNGRWPDPPEFGLRVRDWQAFAAILTEP